VTEAKGQNRSKPFSSVHRGKFLGMFATAVEAAVAYARAATETWEEGELQPAQTHQRAAGQAASASSANRAQPASSVRVAQPASTTLHPPPMPASFAQHECVHTAEVAAAPAAGTALALAAMPLALATMPNLDEGMEVVEALLGRCRLPQYAAKFDEMGYDDVGYLYSIHDQRPALDALAGDVGLKPGHKARFEDLLQCEARQLHMHT